jgi:hypothetical protein
MIFFQSTIVSNTFPFQSISQVLNCNSASNPSETSLKLGKSEKVEMYKIKTQKVSVPKHSRTQESLVLILLLKLEM